MAQSSPDKAESNVFEFERSEAEEILTSIRALRRRILEVWQERGVVLTRDEQKALRAEIVETCALLTELTIHH
jgi:hypothetical protein